MLCAQSVAEIPMFLHADSKDWSDWADALNIQSVGALNAKTSTSVIRPLKYHFTTNVIGLRSIKIMLKHFTTNVMRHFKSHNVFITYGKTSSCDAKIDTFLRRVMARQDYFTHFKQSRTL